MQPYFFPYLGYFRLLHDSDVFVSYDDVQYMKNGWINRNRILVNGQARWLTLPVHHADHLLPISDRHYQLDRKTIASVLGKIECAYRKAPYFWSAFPIIVELLTFEDANVARFNENCLGRIAAVLGLKAEILRSEDLTFDRTLRGEDRVLAICKLLGAGQYLNAPGGTSLYRAEAFAEAGIQLRFLQPTNITYPQFGAPPVANLSIIDVMMFNPLERVQQMLAM